MGSKKRVIIKYKMAEKGMGGREGSIQEVHLQDLANIELVD